MEFHSFGVLPPPSLLQFRFPVRIAHKFHDRFSIRDNFISLTGYFKRSLPVLGGVLYEPTVRPPRSFFFLVPSEEESPSVD